MPESQFQEHVINYSLPTKHSEKRANDVKVSKNIVKPKKMQDIVGQKAHNKS